MRHNIYVRSSAGIILIGNFDLQTQHHWSLIGTKLSYMDGRGWLIITTITDARSFLHRMEAITKH